MTFLTIYQESRRKPSISWYIAMAISNITLAVGLMQFIEPCGMELECGT